MSEYKNLLLLGIDKLTGKKKALQGKQASDENFTLDEKTKLSNAPLNTNVELQNVRDLIQQEVDNLKALAPTEGDNLLKLHQRITFLETLLSEDSDLDSIVSSYNEVKKAFENFPEGLNLLSLLNSKLSFGTSLIRPFASQSLGSYWLDETGIYISNGTIWIQVSYTKAAIDTFILDLQNTKVDKITGKQLSTEDFTTLLLSKLNQIEDQATKNQLDSYLISRANHTGTQLAETISDFILASQNAIIDDTNTLLNKTFSSSKITTELLNAVNALKNGASSNGDSLKELEDRIISVEDLLSTNADFYSTYQTDKTALQLADTNEAIARQDADNAEQTARIAADDLLNTAIGNEWQTRQTQFQDLDNRKVEKEAGKGLSEQNYTQAEKDKVANLPLDTNQELADLNTAITDEVSARQTAITNEQTARGNADTAINTRIDTETQDRIDGDQANEDAITAEQTARQSADTTLQSNIDAETLARQTANNAEITARQQAIIDLIGGASTNGDTLKKLEDRTVTIEQWKATISTLLGQSNDLDAMVNTIHDVYQAFQNTPEGLDIFLEFNKRLQFGQSANRPTAAVANTGWYWLDETGIYSSNGTTWTLAYFTKSEVDTALDLKVDKVAGKQLSTNDFDNAYKAKVDGIQANATQNDTDANLRDRLTHTGTQLATTISDFDTAARSSTIDDSVISSSKGYTSNKVLTEIQTAIIALKGNPTVNGDTLKELEDRIIQLENLLSIGADADNIVNKYNEILQMFQNFPESANLLTELDKRVQYGISTNRPTASVANNGYFWFDETGGYICDSVSWTKLFYSKSEVEAYVLANGAPNGGLSTEYLDGSKTWKDFASNVRLSLLTGFESPTDARIPGIIIQTDSLLNAILKLERGAKIWTSSSESDMLSLAARSGDICIRLDVIPYSLYRLDNLPASTLLNWGVIGNPTSTLDGTVTSVEASTTDNDFILFSGTSGKIIKKTTVANFKTLLALTKPDIGLSNVQNVDATNLSNDTIQGTFTVSSDVIISGDDAKSAFQKTQGQINNKENLIPTGTTSQYYRGDKSWQTLATVATTGSYTDLSNTPTIPLAQVNSDWNSTTGVSQILNKPTIPLAQIQSDWTQADNLQADFIKNKPDVYTKTESNNNFEAKNSNIQSHIIDTSNPHSTTKLQVGLGNVQNLDQTDPANITQSASYRFVTDTDKTKLDGIASGAEVNVQSDWTQTDNLQDDYIKNKPSIYTQTEVNTLLSNKLTQSTSIPTSAFDTTQGYSIGSRHIRTGNTPLEFVCLDATTNSAVWILITKDIKVVTQATHGFTITNNIPLPVYTNTSGTYILAINNATSTLKTTFIIEIIDANTFIVSSAIDLYAPSHGLTVGSTYTTSNAVAGTFTIDDLTVGYQDNCIYVENANKLILRNNLPIEVGNTAYSNFPVGSYIDSTLDSITGFFKCDGSAISRTIYIGLYSIIGISCGSGDGSTTFNLPDYRSCVPGVIGQRSGLTNRTLGSFVGSETHTLTTNQMPSHTHSMGPSGGVVNNQAGSDGAAGGSARTVSTTTGSSGLGEAHNNMQPTFFGGSRFIKY